ncbi:MAG: anti-sigma factor [Saprospiraceae bacterium]
MNKEQVIKSGLLEQYATGLLTVDEEQEIEGYLRKWPELKRYVVEMQDMLQEVGEDYDLLGTNDFNRQGRVVAMRPKSKGADSTSTTPIWRIAAGVLLIGLVTAVAFFYQKNVIHSQKLAKANNQLQQLQRELQDNQTSFASLKESHSFFVHPHTARVQLRSLSPERFAGDIIAYYNPTAQEAILKVVNMPPLTEEKRYQIWADVAGEMIHMGQIETNSTDFVEIPFIPDAESLNITIEPATGSAEPTVEQLVMHGEIEL